MPPRSSRPLLLPPTAAALALAALAACADPTTSPAGTERPAVAPRGPLFAAVSGGVYGEIFDFPEAKWIPGAYTPSLTNCGPDSGTPWACVPPKPWTPTDFDVAIHLRDRSTWDTPEAFRAMHGTYCQPYDNLPDVSRVNNDISHDATTYRDLNFRCRNHMMTAVRATGYGVIYVTPNATVNVSAAGATIRWALSTFRTSANDWVDVWVTPWNDNLKLPLDAGLRTTDLQGPPKNAIHVRMAGTVGATTFDAYQVVNGVETKLSSSVAPTYESILPGLVHSSTRRDTFELTVTTSRVKLRFWRGDNDMTHPGAIPFAQTYLVDAPLATALTGWSDAVVQFGHHSMLGAGAPAGASGTWHWDDFQLAPAAQFQTIRSANVEGASLPNDRYADSKHPDMRLASTMPATGSRFLRFSAYGEKVRVSFDNARWYDVDPQPGQTTESRFQSYFFPIPAEVGSATTVSFKAKRDKLAVEATNEDEGAWRVRDVSIWVR